MKKNRESDDIFYIKSWVFIAFPVIISIILAVRYELERENADYEPINYELPLLFCEKINDINFATMEELTMTPGIGEITSDKIINFIEQQGVLLDVELLLSPIGPLTLKQYFAIRCYFDVLQ